MAEQRQITVVLNTTDAWLLREAVALVCQKNLLPKPALQRLVNVAEHVLLPELLKTEDPA